MVEQHKNLKFMELYDELMQRLGNGGLVAGDKLPSERLLAEEAGISYMTARQAVQALVDKGYLVSKPRVGTFVPFDIEERFSRPTVNIVMPDSESGIPRQFERVIREYCKELSLNINLVKITKKSIAKAQVLFEDHSRPCLVLMCGLVCQASLRDAMLSNPNVMMVGYNLSGIGVKSVLCDDAAAARMAQTILQQAGHDDAAIIVCDSLEPVSQQMISGWRSCRVNVDDSDSGLIELGKGKLCDVLDKKVASLFCKNKKTYSAIITSSIEIGLQLCESLRSIGLSIPQDVSIVTLGQAEYLPHYSPRLTCVDPHLDKQARYAIDAAKNIIQGKQPQLLHLVEPEIIDGESVKILESKS